MKRNGFTLIEVIVVVVIVSILVAVAVPIYTQYHKKEKAKIEESNKEEPPKVKQPRLAHNDHYEIIRVHGKCFIVSKWVLKHREPHQWLDQASSAVDCPNSVKEMEKSGIEVPDMVIIDSASNFYGNW